MRGTQLTAVAILVLIALTLEAHSDPRRMGGLGNSKIASGAPVTLIFCGNGGNAADAYLPPQDSFGQELGVGSAACDAREGANAAAVELLPFGLAGAHLLLYQQYCELTSATLTTTTYQWLNVDQYQRRQLSTQMIAAAGVTESVMKRNDVHPVEVLPGSKLSMQVTAGGEDLTTDDYYCVLSGVLLYDE